MNPLFALLGQAAAPQAASGPLDEYQGQIDVVGNSSKGDPTNYDDYVLNNAPAVIGREQDIKQTEEASDRRGMFGMRGTLRDVLGVLGDAFLVQSGNNPMYAPTRQRERVSDAMAGFTVDPVGASERVAYYDPARGQELFDSHLTNQNKVAQTESLRASRDSLAQDRRFKQYTNARDQIGALLNTPGAVVNGTISPQAIALAERIAASADMTLEEFMISEGMSEEDVRNYAQSVIDPYRQERLDDYDIGLAQGQQNADSRRISATRPRAASRPRAESDREAAIRIGNKPESERTTGERAFYERYTRPPSSGGRTPRRPVPSTGQRLGPVLPRN